MNSKDKVRTKVLENYKDYDINNDDEWHSIVDKRIDKQIYKVLKKYDNSSLTILNVGSGGKTYKTKGKLINMDIVKETVSHFNNYLVGSAEKIPLKDSSIHILICVGSVFNYTDCKKSIKEFYRVLKPNGILILEFERTNSAEFLFTKKHNKTHFIQEYEYQDKIHYLNMYSEKYISGLLKKANFKVKKKNRFHVLSTLLYRMHFNEERVYKFAKLDWLLKPFSYCFAHNCIMICTKA